MKAQVYSVIVRDFNGLNHLSLKKLKIKQAFS